MFLVEFDVTVSPPTRLSDDEITDLIETLVDELDHQPVEPSVGTARNGDDLDVTVGVVIDADGSIDAMTHGLALVKSALHAAGLVTSGLGVQSVLRSVSSRVSELLPAS